MHIIKTQCSVGYDNIASPLRISSMHGTKEIYLFHILNIWNHIHNYNFWRRGKSIANWLGISKIWNFYLKFKLVFQCKVCWVVLFLSHPNFKFSSHLFDSTPSLFPYYMFACALQKGNEPILNGEKMKDPIKTQSIRWRWKECTLYMMLVRGKFYEIKKANVLISFYSFGNGWKQRIEEKRTRVETYPTK